MSTLLHSKTPEEQYRTAPRMPSGRPPTKAEVWEWTVHMYGGTFPEEKLKVMAQDTWAWSYIWQVNRKGWNKQPDWLPGDPVIAAAVPAGPFTPERSHFVHVNKLWAIAQAELPVED